jgi:recombination protein RecT
MTKQNAIAEVRLQLDTMIGQFGAVLPKHIPVERFGRVVLTAVQTTPELLNVERRSLWNACMKAAQDGLLPDGRLGALVTYRDKRRGPIAQWLPMIAGIRQKVRNSGEVATWEVHTVHEKDLFDYELGDNPHITHRPVRGDRGKIIAAYSVAVLKSGERSREVMWIDEIEQVRKMSKAGDGGPWQTWYGEMAKKTVAKRHAKVLPMSSDLDDLLRRDDDDGGEPGPEKAPARNLTDALNMIASLPEPKGKADQVPESDLIEQVDQATGVVSDQADVEDYVSTADQIDLLNEEERKASHGR